MKSRINLQRTLDQIKKILGDELLNSHIEDLYVLRAPSKPKDKDWIRCELGNGKVFVLWGSVNQASRIKEIVHRSLSIREKLTKGYKIIAWTRRTATGDRSLQVTGKAKPVNGQLAVPLHTTPASHKPARKRLTQVIDDWVGSERADWF